MLNKELKKDLDNATKITLFLTEWDSHGNMIPSGVRLEIATPDCEEGMCIRWKDIGMELLGVELRDRSGAYSIYRMAEKVLTECGYTYKTDKVTTGWG